MQQTTISMKMLLRCDVYVGVEAETRPDAVLLKKLLERRVFEYLKAPRMAFQTFEFDEKVVFREGPLKVRATVLTEDEAIDTLK
jgi:hypothetical protein